MGCLLLCLLLPNELHHRDNQVVSVSVCLSHVHGFMSVNKCVSIFVLISILKNKDYFLFFCIVYIYLIVLLLMPFLQRLEWNLEKKWTNFWVLCIWKEPDLIIYFHSECCNFLAQTCTNYHPFWGPKGFRGYQMTPPPQKKKRKKKKGKASISLSSLLPPWKLVCILNVTNTGKELFFFFFFFFFPFWFSLRKPSPCRCKRVVEPEM